MVSFSCESCQDTIKKPKLEAHASRCYGPFTCIDCNTTFQGRDWKTHFKCITEEEKYQKGDMKGRGGRMAPAPSKAVTTEKLVEAENTPVEPPKLHNGDNQKLEKVEKNDKKEKKEKKEREATKQKKEKSTTADVTQEKSESTIKEKNKSKKVKKEKKSNDAGTDNESVVTLSAVKSVANGTSTPKSKEKEKAATSKVGVDKVTKVNEKKKRKASELETTEQNGDTKSKKKKSKKETNGERTSPPLEDDDTPMPDITTLLLPDVATKPTVSEETATIHPSRIQNFTITPTFTEVDPSFRPRAKDIARARRELDRSLNPSKPKKVKLTLEEKQAKRAAKREAKNIPPQPFVRKPIEATRDPIDDALPHFLDGLTGEGQVMKTLTNRLKSDVKAGGRIMNIHQELFARLGLRREGVSEDGSGGKIVVEIIEKRGKPADEDYDHDE